VAASVCPDRVESVSAIPGGKWAFVRRIGLVHLAAVPANRSAPSLALLFALVSAGCSDSPPSPGVTEPPFRERTPLIDIEAFELVDAASDPFTDRPAEPFACAIDGHIVEVFGGVLVYSVYTDKCPYVTAMQPSLADVHAGEFLRVRTWHFALVASEPAEAHLVVGIDGPTGGIDELIPIPNDSKMISKSWRAPRDYPAGTPIYFHVHNHGNNEYLMIELSTGSEDPNATE